MRNVSPLPEQGTDEFPVLFAAGQHFKERLRQLPEGGMVKQLVFSGGRLPGLRGVLRSRGASHDGVGR